MASLIEHFLMISVIGLASCQPVDSEIENYKNLQTQTTTIEVNNDPALWIGPLNADWVNKPHNEVVNNTVILNSEGGANDLTLMIAENLLTHRRTAMVVAFCYSGCTGILPFFENIEFIDEPAIGFHWNAVIMASALNPELYNHLDDPADPFLSNTQRRLEAKVGFDSDVWKHVQDRIDLRISALTKQQHVLQEGSVKWDSKHIMWFPTSDQMRNLLNFEFKGTVCADNPDCIKLRVSQWSSEGSIVVGDTIYENGNIVGEWR